MSQNKSTSPHHVKRDWWGLVPIQIKLPTPCAKGLVGACPNTNQHPHTMCKGIGGGVSHNKSTSPHHVQSDWWGLVPTQINIPTPCVKGLVGACPKTNQRPHTMCKAIGGGVSQYKSNSPHHVQRDWWGGYSNTNQRPHTMCKGIGGGVSQHKSTSPHHVQRDWWGLVPTQINIPTPCAKGLVGACPKTNQRPYTMCKGIGGGVSQHTNQSPHIMCKGSGGGLSQDTIRHPHTMCKGIGVGLSPHHVQRD